MPNVIIKIGANNPNPLFRVSNFLKNYLGKDCRVIPNKNDYTILVGGTTKDAVEIAIKKHVKSIGKGHGGLDFNWEIEYLEISEEQRIRDEIKREYEDKITRLTLRRIELEQKWSKDRNEYESEIKKLKGLIKNEKYKSKLLRGQYEDTLTELRTKKDEINLLNSKLENLQGEFDEYVRTPMYKLFLRRLKKFVRK